MASYPVSPCETLAEQYHALLEVAQAITVHRDAHELFRDLDQRLPQVVPFDYINAVLHDPAEDVMRLWMLVTSIPSTISPGLELPIDESPKPYLGKVMSLFMDCDKMIGKDFETGLANLKTITETNLKASTKT